MDRFVTQSLSHTPLLEQIPPRRSIKDHIKIARHLMGHTTPRCVYETVGIIGEEDRTRMEGRVSPSGRQKTFMVAAR